jgi:hypothetical protein
MGLAEVESARAHRVADRPVVARQLGPWLDVFGCDVVAKGDAARTSVRRIRVVEMSAVVAAEHPELQIGVQGRVGPEEMLKLLGHLVQLVIGKDAVDAAIEPPYDFTHPHPLRHEYSNSVNWAGPQFRFDHHH